MSPHRIPSYPGFSILFAIVICAYLILLAQPELAIQISQLSSIDMQIPPWAKQADFLVLLLCLLLLITLIDIRIFHSRRQKAKESAQKNQRQLQELLENKKQLQAKTHVYAGHAEKLKLFISDKLLEYIEYDEKFLHFKNIASEIRHNGIISYDTTKAVLQQVQEISENNDENAHLLAPTQQALESLNYLWDLLDLSTADNIALHIADQVCGFEEQLFQAELSESEDKTTYSETVFDPREVLTKAINRCFSSAKLDNTDQQLIIIDDFEQAWLSLANTDKLLGRIHHIVLVLENIIGNAQFFSSKKNYQQKHASIAIQLYQREGYIYFSIYNRGPHIDETAAKQLYQLGYSTRRTQGHHGKGLGLYFVKEILKGYDGHIHFDNIDNKNEILSLRIELNSGEVITDIIDINTESKQIDNNKPLCQRAGSELWEKRIQWDFNEGISKVEATHHSDQKTYKLPINTSEKNQRISDPGHPGLPRWEVNLKNQRKKTVLEFKPLDINGVRFLFKLPSLTMRQEGEIFAVDEASMEAQVSEIKHSFEQYRNPN